jgi:hypothetical protein
MNYEPIYYNGYGATLGHMACDVREWLAAHPEYRGEIWFDNRDGGDHVEVTDEFFTEEDEV